MHKPQEAPTSVPPMATEVPIPEKRLSIKKALGVSTVILSLSAAVAFSVRRIIYDRIKSHFPDELRVPISDETGFGITAAAITGPAVFASLVQKNQRLSRRQLLQAAGLSAGAGLIAGLGAAGGSAAVESFGRAREPDDSFVPKE